MDPVETVTCARCKGPIQNKVVVVLKEYWHPECLKCIEKDCDQELGEGYYDVHQQFGPYCERHYLKRIGYLCGVCNEPLRSTNVSALGRRYCVDHFRCVLCSIANIPREDETYYLHNEKVYCEAHYITLRVGKCRGCYLPAVSDECRVMIKEKRKTIDSDEVIRVLERWHNECYALYKSWQVKLVPRKFLAQHPNFELQEQYQRNTQSNLANCSMTEQASKVLEILSLFEQLVVSSISEAVSMALEGNVSMAVEECASAARHVELVFEAVNDLDKRLARHGDGVDLNFQHEPRALCRRLINLFLLLSGGDTHPIIGRSPNFQIKAGILQGSMQQVLEITASIAALVKEVVRAGVASAIKLELRYLQPRSLDDFLLKLTEADPNEVPNLPSNSIEQEGSWLLPSTSVGRRVSIMLTDIRSDACYHCRVAIEEMCICHGNYRWHGRCCVCCKCGSPIPSKSPLNKARWNSRTRRALCGQCAGLLTNDEIDISGEEGFQIVSQLRQYSFLVQVALRRMKALLGNDQLLQPPITERSFSDVVLNADNERDAVNQPTLNDPELVADQKLSPLNRSQTDGITVYGNRCVGEEDTLDPLQYNTVAAGGYSEKPRLHVKSLSSNAILTTSFGRNRESRRRKTAEGKPVSLLHTVPWTSNTSSDSSLTSMSILVSKLNLGIKEATFVSQLDLSAELNSINGVQDVLVSSSSLKDDNNRHFSGRPSSIDRKMSRAVSKRRVPRLESRSFIVEEGSLSPRKESPKAPNEFAEASSSIGRKRFPDDPISSGLTRDPSRKNPLSSSQPRSRPLSYHPRSFVDDPTISALPSVSPGGGFKYLSDRSGVGGRASPEVRGEHRRTDSNELHRRQSTYSSGVTLAGNPNPSIAGRRRLSGLSGLELLSVQYHASVQLSSLLGNRLTMKEIMDAVRTKSSGRDKVWTKLRGLLSGGSKKEQKSEGTFGVPLELLTERTGLESDHGSGLGTVRIPYFLHHLLTAIYQFDLTTEGLFRKNGNIRHLKEMAEEADQNPTSMSFSGVNIIQLAAFLKKFLRELPDPLISFRLYKIFITAQTLQDRIARRFATHLAICLLSRAHRDALEAVCVLMSRVVSRNLENRMDIRNLALCLAPTVLYPKGPDGDNMLAVACLECILEFQDDWWTVPAEIEDAISTQDTPTVGTNGASLNSKALLKMFEGLSPSGPSSGRFSSD